MDDRKPRLFTIKTLAEEWGCSEAQVRKLVKTGQLSAFRIGARDIRIPLDSVIEYETRESNQVQPEDELRRITEEKAQTHRDEFLEKLRVRETLRRHLDQGGER